MLVSPVRLAVDKYSNLYIADSSEHRVRMVTPAGTITTLAGVVGCPYYQGDGQAADINSELYLPTSVAVNPKTGDLYIADSGNDRVRKVAVATGAISTVAGNGTAGFAGDGGAATSAELYQPAGVALDASGNLYIADAANERVRVVGH